MKSQSEILIGGKAVGMARGCYLIAEIGLAHDGSLGGAYALMEAAAEAGADAVKFQTHLARHESTLEEPFRVSFSRQDATRLDYWERTSFTEEQWAGLASRARELGVGFLSSPFSVAAVRLLRRVGVDAWKIGSGEFFSDDLLESLLDDDLPVLLSTGMASWSEIASRFRFFNERGKPLALFQCATKYPSGPEDAGLNVIVRMREEFGCPVGLSDHSGEIYPGLAAIANGASLLEAHFVFDKRMFGPDSKASLTPDQFAQLASGRDWFCQMRANPVDKDAMAENLAPLRRIFTKSVGYATDLPKGTILSEDHLVARKPSTGVPFAERRRFVGSRLAKDVSWKYLLRESDLEG